jgi:hypothetical protein
MEACVHRNFQGVIVWKPRIVVHILHRCEICSHVRKEGNRFICIWKHKWRAYVVRQKWRKFHREVYCNFYLILNKINLIKLELKTDRACSRHGRDEVCTNVVCLFSWRYNPLWLYFHSPVAGFSLLGFEVSWTHTSDTPQSVGLLWTSDQSVAETSTWQHTRLTTDKPPCVRWDSNPQTQKGERPMTYALERAATGTGRCVQIPVPNTESKSYFLDLEVDGRKDFFFWSSKLQYFEWG